VISVVLKNGMDLLLSCLETRVPKVIIQRAEVLFPALKEDMVSDLRMIGIVSSSSLMITAAGVMNGQITYSF
jgi:hypothetical protein